tara:strand:- start:169 stop:738 length:570 start_codon:yes stop_codon:yes gene_type:complete
MKCLFLGYSINQTKLINFLKKKGYIVKNTKKKIGKEITKYNLIVSFGYRKIIEKKILKFAQRPIINLHMSYLPYNRGSHPSFWSFYNKTINGVTIHEINSYVDAGPILFQKKLNYNIYKNKKLTFHQVYKKSFKELENLFIKNFNKIKNKNYIKRKNIPRRGSFHKKKDLPKDIKNFNVSIYNYLNRSK